MKCTKSALRCYDSAWKFVRGTVIKVVLILVASLIVVIGGAKLAFEANSYGPEGPYSEPWAQNTMKFTSWNGEKWTAWVRDGAFEQRPDREGKWHSHADVSLAFVGWGGQFWQARVDGESFLLAPRGDWKGAAERADAIRYRDWTGNNQLRTLAQLNR